MCSTGLLIFLNTFASSVLFAVGLPVLLLWPRISTRMLCRDSKKNKDDVSSDKGEFTFSDDPHGFREKIFRLFVMYLVFNGLKVSVIRLGWNCNHKASMDCGWTESKKACSDKYISDRKY